MSLSPDKAAETLRDITAVEAHSRRLYGYRQASPHLVLWGILWVLGYGVTAIRPALGHIIWTAIWLVGLSGDFAISSSRAPSATTAERGRSLIHWRFPALTLTIFAFIFATCAVMAPINGRQVAAFIPLVVATGYTILGLWLGLRFVAVGVALAILTLGGFFLLPAYFGLWMAIGGGGALILAGLWLRRV